MNILYILDIFYNHSTRLLPINSTPNKYSKSDTYIALQ